VILGLTPKYLFSLDCFTATLPPNQADHFWDGLQVLVQPESDAEADTGNTEDENPQVFLVSGWGEPGSALTKNAEGDRDHQQRREWTCWVAAHRLKTQGNDGEGEGEGRRLIVVEFELEQDIFNPLYPPAGSSTTATTTTTDDNTLPALVDQPGHGMASGPGPGLAGDPTWVPTAEAILASTTSHSKPLRALERMRRLTRSSTTPGRAAAQNVGTMDVFAVLAQANEQLSRALDLAQLLATVVGVVRDLTQFHRVLVYQFDESWNGQVRRSGLGWWIAVVLIAFFFSFPFFEDGCGVG
jgi:hypothetical protein